MHLMTNMSDNGRETSPGVAATALGHYYMLTRDCVRYTAQVIDRREA